jgi:predicted TIM-barrel fold metal-dependent hydrolase
MADLVPFLDAHVHFWDHTVPGLKWGWLQAGFTQGTRVEEFDIDRPRYTPAELRADAEGLGLAGVIHIQAAEPMDDPSEETAWLSGVAAEQGWPSAIVGACKLRAPDAPDLLRRHAAASDRFRGIRDLWCSPRAEPEQVAPAMAVAAELGISIEFSMPMAAFPMMRTMAHAFPEVTFVLGAAGFPKTREAELYDEWAAGVRLLAGAPNFVSKITATGRGNPDWTAENTKPWVLGCIEAFGLERCMYASNWPYDQPVATYPQIVRQLREISADMSLDDQHALFHGNAERVYRTPLEET